MGDVHLVFSDETLGGTSRSALEAGRAWRRAGYEVVFRPELPPHPKRLGDFQAVGEVLVDSNINFDKSVRMVHYHHGAWSRSQIQTAGKLVSLAQRSVAPPRLLTHNIFGVSDRRLDAWPQKRTVGVLAAWVGAQYRSSMGGIGVPSVVAVPNALDTDLFRFPSSDERRRARERFGLSGRVVLRVGSPHMGKWSKNYVNVVAAHPDITFVFVGLPDALRGMLLHRPNVRVENLISDEFRLRDLYWAADVFLHLADRGESFGNVLLESVSSGLKVISLARPYRDNSPWEFMDLESFYLCGRVDDCSRLLRRDDIFDRQKSSGDRVAVDRRYSSATVADLLRRIEAEEPIQATSRLLAPRDRLRVAVRHNPAVDLAKRLRLRLQA